MSISRIDKIASSAGEARERLRGWRRRANEAAGQMMTDRLDKAAARLDLPAQGLPHTREALYATRSTLETFPWEIFGIAWVLLLVPVKCAWWCQQAALSAADLAGRQHLGFLQHGLHAYGESFQGFITPSGQPIPPIGWLAMLTLMAPFFFGLIVVMPRRMGRGADRRYTLNTRILTALELCADLAELPPTRRQRSLRRLDRLCQAIEQNILDAHRRSGTIPRRSTRRGPAKKHAALVAGILRQQITELDTDPDKGITEVSSLLASICENYAANQIGALVDTASYPDAQPLSTARQAVIETVRIAVALAAATGTATFIAAVLPDLSFVPEQARAWLTFGCACLAALLTSGWNVFSKIISMIPGKS